jgi:drug/metabolite transporter (DMT)-like permease
MQRWKACSHEGRAWEALRLLKLLRFDDATIIGVMELRTSDRRRRLGMASVVGVAALFCSFTLLSRKGLTRNFEIEDLAWLRFTGGALILFPWFARYRLAGLGLARALALALCGGIGFATLAYSGFRLAPAAHGGVLLHGTLPLFGTIFGMIVLRQVFPLRRVVGVAVIVLGVATIALDGFSTAGFSTSSERGVLIGDLCLLAAAAAWSLYGALLARWKVAATPAAALVATGSFVLFAIVNVASGTYPKIEPSAEFLIQAVFQGVLIGAASIFLYSHAVTMLGATTTALATTVVPVLTILGAIPLLDEWPTPQTSLGAVVATIGMIVTLYPQRTDASGPSVRVQRPPNSTC